MEKRHFKLGVFMPVGNNGWIISKTSPQYLPTYQPNKDIAQRAEQIGFDYFFSMAKWNGYGGETRFWDHTIESFSLMAAPAPVTSRLQLVASIAPILVHPTIVAKMAVTLDDISGGRLGVNIVSSDTEYTRMGLYPKDFESYRHDYIEEWLDVVKRLWTGKPVEFSGKYFTLSGYSSNPRPVQEPWPTIGYATNPEGGFRFRDRALRRGLHPLRRAEERDEQKAERDGPRAREKRQNAGPRDPHSGLERRGCAAHPAALSRGADLEAIANVYDRGNSGGDRRAKGLEILNQRFPRPLFYASFPLIGGPERIADFIEDMAVNGDFDGMLFSFPDYLKIEILGTPGRGVDKEMNIIADGWKAAGVAASLVVLSAAQTSDRERNATYSGTRLSGSYSNMMYSDRLRSTTVASAANRWSGVNQGGYHDPQGRHALRPPDDHYPARRAHPASPRPRAEGLHGRRTDAAVLGGRARPGGTGHEEHQGPRPLEHVRVGQGVRKRPLLALRWERGR